MAEVKEKPKGPLGKLKEVAEDKEEWVVMGDTISYIVV